MWCQEAYSFFYSVVCRRLQEATGSAYDILFGMRRCRINLPNRRYHLIGRVAHRAFEFEGLQAANRKGRYDKENLLWQFTVAIKSDPVGSGGGNDDRHIVEW